jgi:deazaflavin-dependent oxidoreductase (nitroreductase family)
VHGPLYRALGGRLVDRYGKARILLLTTTGRRTGRRRTVPLVYAAAGDALVLVASMGGEPRHPAWFHNLQAHPEAEVELRGRERRRVRARVAEGEERDRLWRQMVALCSPYETYARRTARRIPVVVLEPVSGTSSAPAM